MANKAEEAKRTALLESYGNAIKGCLDYYLDYRILRYSIEDPADRAREVIRANIVEHLQRHLALWERRSETPSVDVVSRDEVLGSSKKVTELGKIPGARSPPSDNFDIPQSFFTLFSDSDMIIKRRENDGESEFVARMTNFRKAYLPRLCRDMAPKPIRIAILDTGLCIDRDDSLQDASVRVLKDLSKNFVALETQQVTMNDDYEDTHGHGTHVAKLILSHTRAEVVVIKISTGPTFATTRLQQLVNALNWAGVDEHGANADIINLSFGLDESAKPLVQPVIKNLLTKKKLVFAAASNSGGNGRRAYPANQIGVFAIHATTESGNIPEDLNPPAETNDNFATFGYNIPSRWKGEDMYIRGTSFASPIAAGIAANVLEFVRRENVDPGYFSLYGGMRRLFSYLCSPSGNYDYLRPWKHRMFSPDQSDKDEIRYRLQQMAIIHDDVE